MRSCRSVRIVGLHVGFAVAICLPVSDTLLAQDIIPAHSLRGLLIKLGGGASTDESDQIDIIAVLTGLEVSTAPLGTSTGGFTFTFDTQSGTFSRSTTSFGPAFGKRSLTTGKGKLTAGFNWLHASYDSLGGLNLQNGDLRVLQNVRNLGPPEFPESYSSITAHLTSDTMVGIVTFGASPNIDVGIAVPWVQVSLDADIGFFTAENVDVTPGSHRLVLPRTSDAGLGDIALFGKYRMWQHGDAEVAGEAEVRMPSGDTDNLRGLGVTRALFSTIWSREGTISPHANIGFEFWSAGVRLVPSGQISVRHQMDYAIGLEVQAHPRATMLIDIVGRHEFHGGRLAYRTVTVGSGSLDALRPIAKGLDAISVAPGIKWNAAGNVLLTANLLASVANRGLRANLISVVGMEWAF